MYKQLFHKIHEFCSSSLRSLPVGPGLGLESMDLPGFGAYSFRPVSLPIHYFLAFTPDSAYRMHRPDSATQMPWCSAKPAAPPGYDLVTNGNLDAHLPAKPVLRRYRIAILNAGSNLCDLDMSDSTYEALGNSYKYHGFLPSDWHKGGKYELSVIQDPGVPSEFRENVINTHPCHALAPDSIALVQRYSTNFYNELMARVQIHTPLEIQKILGGTAPDGRDLKSIVEQLYDLSKDPAVNRGRWDALLKSYKEMTGKDRPAFVV